MHMSTVHQAGLTLGLGLKEAACSGSCMWHDSKPGKNPAKPGHSTPMNTSLQISIIVPDLFGFVRRAAAMRRPEEKGALMRSRSSSMAAQKDRGVREGSAARLLLCARAWQPGRRCAVGTRMVSSTAGADRDGRRWGAR